LFSFLKDLINGVKKFVQSDRMRHLAIPQYETLKVVEMIKFADEHSECKFYLPIPKEIFKIPKQWFCNIIYSIIGQPFKDWVKEKIVERNSKIIDKA
jgi:hypothetical protein